MNRHFLDRHHHQPQRNFDIGRLDEEFEQFVGVVPVIQKTVLADSVQRQDDQLVDDAVRSAHIAFFIKPYVDLFGADYPVRIIIVPAHFRKGPLFPSKCC